MFTLAYSGFKNDDNASDLDVLPTISCEANVSSSVGFYDIVLSGGSDKNYYYTLINGQLEVLQGSNVETLSATSLQVYPNPATNFIYIQSESPVEKIEIYNQSGVCMLINDNVTEKTDVSGLANGFYLARIYVDGIPVNKKIVIKNN